MKDRREQLQYRYPGVTPFSTEQSHIFFGREEEKKRLLKLVLRQQLAVLYGKSGLGKSSLINAGLIPQINKAGLYSPLLLRFGAWTDLAKDSPLDITKDLLKENAASDTFLSGLVPGDDSLWLNAKNRQLKGGGRLLLLFDQFEELFSYPESDIAAFQQGISELLHTGIPLRFRRKLETQDELSEEDEDRLETPLETRILLIIRSDKLHLLDRLKDYLPNILRHTYELKALGLEDSRAAIQFPAQKIGDFATPPFSFSESALEKLLDFLKDPEDQRIEGILIQMLCEHYERKQVAKSGFQLLGLTQIGDPAEVVGNYYEEKIGALAPADQLTARRLIEEGLVSEGEGMRLNLHEAFIRQEYQADESLLDELVEMRLLRSEPFLRGGYTYELSHDRLASAVIEARTHRKEAEAAEEREKEAIRLKAQAKQERLEKEKVETQLRAVRGLLSAAIIVLILAGAGLIYAFYVANDDKEKARILYDQSWYALFAHKPLVAVQAAKETLKLNPKAKGVNTNLALGYLLSNQWEEAEKIYVEWKGKQFPNDSERRLFDDIFLMDIKDLEAAGITHSNFEKVKKMFQK